MLRAAWLGVLVSLGACSNGAAAGDGGAANVDAHSSTPVTYYGDVRPILAAHCTGCHREGEIGTAFDTYDAAAPASGLIATNTAERRMPPFLADGSGACQHFDTTEWLSDAELATLAAWNDQGAPMGDPTTPEPMITPVPHLSGPDVHTIDIGTDYAPDRSLNDDYHCFLVTPPAGGYVTGGEVHPGNPRAVHHVIVYQPSDDAAVAEVMALDAAQPGPGYTCFGNSGTNDALPLVIWAPGGGAAIAPAGTGIQIDATRPLIVQVHYNLLAVGVGETDRSSVDMQIAASAIPGFFLPVYDFAFAAPPHMSAYTHSVAFPFGATYLASFGVANAHVYSVGPHMHTLGTNVQVDLMAAGGDQCMVHIPRWDFGWQRGYRFQEPVPITDTTQVRITCTWDTSSRDTTVTWGEGTQDEMCLAYLYVSI